LIEKWSRPKRLEIACFLGDLRKEKNIQRWEDGVVMESLKRLKEARG
jgi:hypothetical protein